MKVKGTLLHNYMIQIGIPINFANSIVNVNIKQTDICENCSDSLTRPQSSSLDLAHGSPLSDLLFNLYIFFC